MSQPELIQSTKIVLRPGFSPLYNYSRVKMLHNPNQPPEMPTLPRPAYFALREMILWIKRSCAAGA